MGPSRDNHFGSLMIPSVEPTMESFIGINDSIDGPTDGFILAR